MKDEMYEATLLTRDGRLSEATALIQRTLGVAPADPAGPPADPAGVSNRRCCHPTEA